MLTANMKMIAECADKLAHLGEKLFNETEMKYRAGDKVRIKSLDWYNENKGMNDLVGLFTPSMKKLCGMVVTLDSAYNGKYTAIEEEAKGYYLDDSMIEGLADDLTKVEGITQERINTIVHESCILFCEHRGCGIPRETCTSLGTCDEHDEYRKHIRTYLEKKKKEYPKTIEECEDKTVAGSGYKTASLLIQLEKLLICRDAYWKIAGEEMGLGKPWEIDPHKPCYFIAHLRTGGIIKKLCGCVNGNANFAFPTEEMRDAFYENFKSEIESCKELL